MRRMRQDPATAHAAQAADAGRAGRGGDHGEWGTDGVDRRWRTAHAPADRRDRPAAARPQQDRVPLHQRGAAAQAPAQVRAAQELLVDGAHRRAARAARRVGVQGRRVRPGRRRHRAGQGRPLPGDDEHDVLRHRHPAGRHRRAGLPQRRARRRQHADLPRVRLREGAGPGALARRRADPRAVQEGLRRRPAQEVAAQPLADVPGLPRGQGRPVLHRLGHPVVLAAGLAEAVLPARRRAREHLQGADRGNRRGRLRPRQGRALLELHGALRLRAVGGPGHDGLPEGVHPGGDLGMTSGGRLGGIGCPEDLRALPAAELPALAAEIRAVLLDTVSRTGGHLGPNLGVVELTLALHRVFESPRDRLVWDTRPQSYVHKLLTGRRPAFGTLRQSGGLAGYPSRAESEHDLVENSHASPALAWADGLSRACALRGETDRTVVAVIGDGALTGGLAWEALNNLGAAAGRPVVVVLNDNGRSYAPTVGGLAAHLAELRAGRGGSVFAALGLGYLGPVDGHDVAALEAALTEARDRRTPTVVHVLTTKGCGHRPAEEHELDRMHAVSPAAVPVADPRAVPAPVSGVPRPVWTSLVGA